MKIEWIKKWFAFILIYIFNLLPIKNNKIFLFSYYGAQFGCNPKYISQFITNHYPKDMFEIVWAFNDPESKGFDDQFRKVKTMSLRYFYDLCTAKVIITNFRTTDLFIKRKEQYYIQTWHSSLRLKQIEKDVENVLPSNYVQMAKRDSIKCDLLLSGCKYSTDIFKKSFWYDGEIFEFGTPRNDLLLQNNDELKNKVFKKLNIPLGTNVLLYAPTFRKNNNLQVYDLDFSNLIKSLTEKFGGKWVVLIKLHPHLMSKSNKLIESEHVFNVTTYDDIQELLLISDVLVSDYSSLIFDFSITKRPCFLYIPDMEEYMNNERKLYFDFSDLPFISAVNHDDLFDKVKQFDNNNYQKNLEDFLKKIGSYEEGKANEFLLKRIEEICFDEGRDELYEAI